jgi:hypothetical protein
MIGALFNSGNHIMPPRDEYPQNAVILYTNNDQRIVDICRLSDSFDWDPPVNCSECGAKHPEGRTCRDDFYRLLYWENENPALGIVHHLTVLCYHLQHPGLYSPAGLAEAMRLLDAFVMDGASPGEMGARNRARLSSQNRDWKIIGADGWRGAYGHPIRWTMTAADVTAGGPEVYVENVNAWSRSVLVTLKSSGNL